MQWFLKSLFLILLKLFLVDQRWTFSGINRQMKWKIEMWAFSTCRVLQLLFSVTETNTSIQCVRVVCNSRKELSWNTALRSSSTCPSYPRSTPRWMLLCRLPSCPAHRSLNLLHSVSMIMMMMMMITVIIYLFSCLRLILFIYQVIQWLTPLRRSCFCLSLFVCLSVRKHDFWKIYW